MPTPTKTPNPQTAIQKTVQAAWTPTPLPLICPPTADAMRLMPQGAVCMWATETPRPIPTSTPFPACETPVPGASCEPNGSWRPPFGATPVPIIQ